MGTRSDFVGKKKGVGVELDLRMQENQAAASGHKRLIGFPHHNSCCYYNHNHDESQSQLSSSSSSWENISGGGGGVGAAGPGGSIFCNTSNQVAFMGDIYDVVGAASGSGSGTSNSAVLMSKSVNTCDSSLFPFNSSVGDQMAAAASVNLNVRVPFTAAQLQELERQTMIYKFMMASVPVPRELILPITKTPSRVPLSQSNSSVELGLLSNNNSDPEPWRCRRTDGKKWRCSRDVAPDQKYCERHSHKSRPRSRKPVEVPTHSSKNDQTLKHSLNLASNKSQFVNQTMLSSMASSDEQPRCLEWFMKGQTMPVASNSNQEWHHKHLIDSNSCINLGGDQNLTFQAHQRLVQDQYSLLVSPKLVSHQAPTQETRHFIDAWSMADENNANERLPFSPLALSMSGGSEIIERNENALMGGSLGIMGSEGENLGTLRPHWMNHDSGMRSPPGGPLAEALCLGIASSAKLDSNTASPRGGCSTSTTTSSKSSGGDGSRSFNLTD